MSAPFLSALGDLDGKLQAAEAQLQRVSAALPLDDLALIQAFQEASRLADVLAALIRTERPQARWNNREELDSLVLELEEEAEARLEQQRRARLLEVAEELEAGHVKHRFAARTEQLNALRDKAALELRAQAALPDRVKELPGPGAGGWLIWAFNLTDDEDENIVRLLQTDFAAVEAFTGQMEEMYWVSGRRSRPHLAAPPVAPETPAASDSSYSPSVARDNATTPPDALPAQAVTETQNGVRDPAFASAYQRNAAQATATEVHSAAEVAQQWESPTAPLPVQPAAQPAAEVVVPAPAVLTVPVAATVASPPPHDTRPEAEAAVPSVAATEAAEEPKAAATTLASSDEDEPPATERKSFADLIPARKRSVVAWAGVGSFIILSGLFFAILHHLHERNSKPTSTVQAATIGTGTASTEPEPDASGDAVTPSRDNSGATAAGAANSRPPLLHKQSAEGAQDSIALTLEQCGRNADHVECWGYVSNLGGANSKVSLDRVDVVDGRGNSFSLVRNGQFAFPNGDSSSIAAGNRLKYTVRIPDKDLDARTLTLYMDLSNPRSLEYTFRDVPIVR